MLVTSVGCTVNLRKTGLAVTHCLAKGVCDAPHMEFEDYLPVYLYISKLVFYLAAPTDTSLQPATQLLILDS
jgi:hypothetical protein